ncbi:hypothetical protein ACFLUD_01730 [Chloroflexota bacterium]
MTVEFKTEAERKKARFWHRFFTGAESADVLRYLTINSSDESVVLGLDIFDSFRKLVKRMRRKYGVFEYFGVVEQDKKIEGREHLHLICKGVFMPQRELEDMWIDVHRSIKPYIKKVYSIGGAAGYLAKYLGKERSSRYIMSAGWVFPGWISWSKWYKRNYGLYPDGVYPGALVRLSRMSKDERDEIVLPELARKLRGGKRSRALECKRPLTAGDGELRIEKLEGEYLCY